MSPGRSVLIVDDEQSFLSSMRRLLRKETFQVFTTESGEAALALLEAEDISVIVVDYMMPGMDGINLLQRVRRDWPQTVTIMLTAHCELEVALRAINELGIYKFFLKPVSNEELIGSIRHALAHLENAPQNTPHLFGSIKSKEACLRALEQDFPGITKFELDGPLQFFPPR